MRIRFIIDIASTRIHSSIFPIAIWCIISNSEVKFAEEASISPDFSCRFVHMLSTSNDLIIDEDKFEEDLSSQLTENWTRLCTFSLFLVNSFFSSSRMSEHWSWIATILSLSAPKQVISKLISTGTYLKQLDISNQSFAPQISFNKNLSK